ncbi:MarR family transcriptional regulator [Hartmannibacter diazotrophicus]|uniref:MarR family winged helix-turn-helix transcriptional regulator n=1 Tax=Hartmannibacter diazotrophicus TaxID=1482074 RepID=UPI003184116E
MATNAPQDDGSPPPAASESRPAPDHVELIELIFFSYRDFVGDADVILAKYGFGRAHHRVLHFVERNPGMTVAELLDILRITKQSLGRVLKQLIDEDFIEQRPGAVDRRQRLLHATVKGSRLARELNAVQSRRVEAALSGFSSGERETVSRFLTAMIGPDGGDVPAEREAKDQ